MKKIVRRLSTRKPGGRTLTTPASASTAGSGSSSLCQPDPQSHPYTDMKAPSASGTQPGFIPFGTTLHFPACPHTTPPTPRPANIPPVLLTQVSSTPSPTPSLLSSPHRSRERIVAADSDTTTGAGSGAASRDAVIINQFFTTPRRCFDCTVSQMRNAQRMEHEAFDAKICAGRKRIGLGCADLASLEMQLHQQQSSGGDGNGKTIRSDISALRGEILQAKKIVREWVAKRDEQVETMWNAVKGEWEGGVREVVRDDGSGEGLEKCVFRMSVVPVPDIDVDGRQGDSEDESGYSEGGIRVEIVWEKID